MKKLSLTGGATAVSLGHVIREEYCLTILLQYMDKYLQFPPPGNQPNEHTVVNETYGAYEVYSKFYAGMCSVDSIALRDQQRDARHYARFGITL